jgi:hypothetical protein
MKSIIPELFNEQNLLKHLDDFYEESRLCRLIDHNFVIEGYKPLQVEGDLIYTDGNHIITLEFDYIGVTKIILYAIVFGEEELSLGSRFEIYVGIDKLIISKNTVKIINNLIYILGYGFFYIIDMKDGKIITEVLKSEYDELHVINSKVYLKYGNNITVFGDGKPYDIITNYTLTIQNNRIFSYTYYGSGLIVEEFIDNNWVNKYKILGLRLMPQYEILITYVNENILFISNYETVYIIRGDKLETININTRHKNNVIVDKYGKRAIIGSRIYDIKLDSFSDNKENYYSFVYI